MYDIDNSWLFKPAIEAGFQNIPPASSDKETEAEPIPSDLAPRSTSSKALCTGNARKNNKKNKIDPRYILRYSFRSIKLDKDKICSKYSITVNKRYASYIWLAEKFPNIYIVYGFVILYNRYCWNKLANRWLSGFIFYVKAFP